MQPACPDRSGRSDCNAAELDVPITAILAESYRPENVMAMLMVGHKYERLSEMEGCLRRGMTRQVGLPFCSHLSYQLGLGMPFLSYSGKRKGRAKREWTEREGSTDNSIYQPQVSKRRRSD
jgi:hypothetical protein